MTMKKLLTLIALAGALAVPGRVLARQDPTVAALLLKAGAYLADYEKQFAAVVSEEQVRSRI
jgi:hypothetical protein